MKIVRVMFFLFAFAGTGCATSPTSLSRNIASTSSGEAQGAMNPSSGPSCANLAGTYQGTCTNHEGGDYSFSAYAKVTQTTNYGGPGGIPLHAGQGCASVSFLEWTGENPQNFQIIEKFDFSILQSTKTANATLVENQDAPSATKTTITTAQWSTNRQQFDVFRSISGKVEGEFPYAANETTSLSLSSGKLLESITGQGTGVFTKDCTFTRIQ
jgi:hypothetical protein